MLIHSPFFQAVSDASHYREETRFRYLQRCEGSGQRACEYPAERRTDEGEGGNLSLLGICRLINYILVQSSYLTYIACFS